MTMDPEFWEKFVELLQHEMDERWQVHQVEIDRRFDRVTGRLAQLERNFVDAPRRIEELNRKMPEYELALRKYFLELVDPLAALLEEQMAMLKKLQETVDRMGRPPGPLGI